MRDSLGGLVTVADSGVRVSWLALAVILASVCVLVAVPTTAFVTTGALLHSGVVERPDPKEASENPWGFSLVIDPRTGKFSYYVRDPDSELGRAIVGDVFKDAAELHANIK